MSSYLRRALARTRSAEVPGPDFAAGPPPEPYGEPLPVPPALDRLLRLSLAGGRLRPVPSAGALHPVETRLLLGAGLGVRPGRYGYDPGRHLLLGLGGAPDPVPRGGAFALLGARPERTVSHYGHRGWPLVLLDVGHAAAGLVTAARAAEGAPAAGSPAPAWCVGASFAGDPAKGMRFPLAAVRLTGDGELREGELRDGKLRDAEFWNGELREAELRDGELRYRELRDRAAEPGERPDDGAPGDLAEARRVLGEVAGARGAEWIRARARPPAATSSPLRRRSADPGEIGSGAPPPDRETLLAVLEAAEAVCPADGPRWCLAVGGRDAPGLIGTEHGAPRTLATGEVLPTLAVWAAGQGWLTGAGAVLLAYGCPRDAGPARIRRDHLLAGHAVGHAQLAAAALGTASRPVGSWQRADLGAALGGEPGRDWVIHGLALGRRRTPAAAPRTTTGEETS
ncbi:nitroreductase [Streptomyces sp. NPDC020141]|uniref:nitroreductase n=1 Tax=Streptomyces sp. NPDC020141 TaxID=3365065 RepID=UPI00378F1BEE